jgi:hypothetical protein
VRGQPGRWGKLGKGTSDAGVSQAAHLGYSKAAFGLCSWRTGDERPIASALSGGSAVVDHRVGDEGIIAAGSGDTGIALSNTRSIAARGQLRSEASVELLRRFPQPC